MNSKVAVGAQVREPADRWTTTDAAELYDVASWGKGYFSVGENGNLLVHPTKRPIARIDLEATGRYACNGAAFRCPS